jgi:hypothetical protein
MKTLKLRTFFGAASIIGGLLLGAGPVCATEPGATTEEGYQKDNALIKEEIAAVHLHHARINELCTKLKKDKAANLDEAVVTDERDLLKAKADLKRSKAYLAADKIDLKNDYRLAIRNHNADVKKAQANLDKYKAKLDKDIITGTEEAIAYDANKIAYYQNEVRRHNNLAKLEADHLDSNFATIDKEYNAAPRLSSSVKTETAYTPIVKNK